MFANAAAAIEAAANLADYSVRRREPMEMFGVMFTAWTFRAKHEDRWLRLQLVDEELDVMPPKVAFDYVYAELTMVDVERRSEASSVRKAAS